MARSWETVSSLGLGATRSVVRYRGDRDGKGGWWVVDRWHVVKDSALVGQRERERMREEEKRDGGCSLHDGRQMVDGACTSTKACTAVRFLWCSLSLSLSLSLPSDCWVLSEAGNELKVKWVRNWFYKVRVSILQSTKIYFQFDQIFMRIQTPSRK